MDIVLSWQAALAICVSVMTLVGGAIAIAKVIRGNTNSKDAEAALVDFTKFDEELREVEKKVQEIQSALDGNDIRIENVNSQLGEVKTSITRIHDKLEKLTDIIIRNFHNKE